MEIEKITENYKDYDEFILKNPKSNIFQSTLWGDFRKDISNISYDVFVYKNKDMKILTSALVQIKGKNPIKYAYIEKGPVFSKDKKINDVFMDYLINYYKNQKMSFICFDTNLEKEDNIKNYISHKTKNYHSHQPLATLLIDLSLSEEELLKQMKHKGRYNIKIALKNNIKVIEEESCDNFYNIMEITSKRDNFKIHSKKYYDGMIKSLKDNTKILTAYYKDVPLSSAIYVYFKDTFIYYYGASSNRFRSFMAPYLLQFEAIKLAKKMGFRYFDFFGIAENDSKNHPWRGITQFKTRFGGIEKYYHKPQIITFSKYKVFAYKILKKIL